MQQATGLDTLNRIKEMHEYAISNQCRRKLILAHFNEEYFNSNCQMCDNCLKSDQNINSLDETVNLDNLAMNILVTVYDTGHKFGETYIINILQGKLLKRIVTNQHDKIKSFGIEQNLHDGIIRSGIKSLINSGHLTMNIKKGFSSRMSFATLDLKPLGLTKLQELSCHKYESSIKLTRPKEVTLSKIDKPLRRSHTRNDTLIMLKNGKTISEITEHSQFAYGTIIQHITDLVKNDKTVLNYLDHIKPLDERIDRVCDAINQTGELSALTPIKEILDSSYTYDEIRLCKLYLELDE